MQERGKSPSKNKRLLDLRGEERSWGEKKYFKFKNLVRGVQRLTGAKRGGALIK